MVSSPPNQSQGLMICGKKDLLNLASRNGFDEFPKTASRKINKSALVCSVPGNLLESFLNPSFIQNPSTAKIILPMLAS